MVTAVDVVDPASITDADAQRAGFASSIDLCAELAGRRPDLPVYRVEFRLITDPDPRAALADDDALSPADIVEVTNRLARLDRTGPTGPWTSRTLALIAAHPARRAPDLAGMERNPFKLDVRKLKALGLTESLKVGYRLSARGHAYLTAIVDPPNSAVGPTSTGRLD